MLNQKLEDDKEYLLRKEEILMQKVEFEASKASRRKKIMRRKRNLQAMRQQEAVSATRVQKLGCRAPVLCSAT